MTGIAGRAGRALAIFAGALTAVLIGIGAGVPVAASERPVALATDAGQVDARSMDAASPVAAAAVDRAGADDGGAAPGAALARYGSCLADHREGDLLLLIDTSGSMQSTDPDAARVDAAEYLLQQLTTSTGSGGVRLNVAVAGFAGDYQTVADWTALDAGSLPGLTAAVESFRERADGFETDYWTGLQGARESFAQRAQLTPEGHRCQAVTWFTDGELEIATRATAQEQDEHGLTKPYADGVQLDTDAGASSATAAAADDICRPAGLADQLRAAGVVTLAVGLAPPDRAAPDYGRLQSIATGSAGCGAITDPAAGEFYPVKDLDDLILAFDRLSTPGQAPLETAKKVCQGAPCAAEEHVFVLDDSIPSVHILATANAAGLVVLLTAPSGAAVTLSNPGIGVPQNLSADGNDVSYAWRSETAVSVDLTHNPAATRWAGKWSVTFVDPASQTPDAVSRTNIHLSTALFPALLNASAIAPSSGSTVPGLAFGVVNSAGAQVDPASLQSTVSMSAELLGSAGTSVPILTMVDRTALAGPVSADLTSVPPGPATLRMTLALTTAATVDGGGQPVPGTAVAPRVVDLPLLITAPVPAPADGATAVAPAPLPAIDYRADFGTTDELTATTQLAVTGPGCAWVPAESPAVVSAAPRSSGAIDVTSPIAVSADSCLQVAAGATATLPLTLSVEHPGTGGVNGTISVMIAPDGHLDQAVAVPVDFAADLRKPLVGEVFWLTFGIALLLALGIPLALLYLAKYLSARIPRVPLAHALIPVAVDGGRLTRGGTAFALSDSDLRQVVSVSGAGRRRLPVDGLELRTGIGRSPIGPGQVIIDAPGMVGASSCRPPWTGTPPAGRLPLAVHNNWAVLHNLSGDPAEGSILILLDATGDEQARTRITDDINARAADLFAALRAAAMDAGPTAPAQPPLVGAGFGAGGTAVAGSAAGFGYHEEPPAQRGFGYDTQD